MPQPIRCFRACGPEPGSAVFLVEDSWNVVSKLSLLSHDCEMPQALHKQNTKNSPPHEYDTHKGSHSGTGSKSCDLPQHRLVHECQSHRLDEFVEARELVTAIRDASAAHGEAARLADTLHPDICPRNIKIQRDQNGQARGYLIDWDHSIGKPLLERNSTWQFRAVRLLREEERGKTIPIPNRIDGVESFFHVLTWMALRYTTHRMSKTHLTASLRENFDSFEWYDIEGEGRRFMSPVRTGSLCPKGILIGDARFGNEGIHEVLVSMRVVLHERYTKPETRLFGLKGAEKKQELKYQESELRVKERELESLNDPSWLSNLLDEVLMDGRIDWETNKDRKEYELCEVNWVGYRRFLC